MKDYTEQVNTEIMRILTENPIIGENGKKVHVAFAYYAGADGEPSEESNIVFRRNATKAGSVYGSGQQLNCKYYQGANDKRFSDIPYRCRKMFPNFTIA